MAWAKNRETKREEDKAYSLLGIFDIYIPLIYGEGTKNALYRLQDEFHKRSNKPQLDELSTPQIQSSTIPFRRDPDFIVRQTLLDQLHEKCAALASRTALVGFSGVGKSQLAIEYSYRVRCQSPETWVFWIHASNAARFEQSFREIADHVKIPSRKDPKANIFKIVYDWLRDEKNGKWLLILDNADDTRWLLEAHVTTGAVPVSGFQERPLWEYLPQIQHGSALVMTRSRAAAVQLVEERDIIAVEPMDEVHAIALLQRKLGTQSDGEDAIELVAMLDFMPLAIVQAAAYIGQRASQYSIRQYIKKFQKTDRSKTSLLTHKAGHFRRDQDARNSIIITLQISFDYILQERPSAADLLSLISSFDRKGIPEGLLRNRGKSRSRHENLKSSGGNNGGHENEQRESEPTDSESNDKFEDDILMLRNYSLIFANTDKTFGMHRLAQLATRTWLEVTTSRSIASSRQKFSSMPKNPPAAPSILTIDENAFERGPIRELLVEIKGEFAKGRDWGLKPAVVHENGALTYSLLCYEICDIGETGIFSLLEAIENLLRNLLGLWTVLPNSWRRLLRWLESMRDKVRILWKVLYLARGEIGSFLSFTFFSCIFPILYTLLYMARAEIGSFLCSSFCSSFHILCAFLGVPTERVAYTIFYIFCFLFLFLVAEAVWIYLIRLAKKILAFIRGNKFWTHGHLQLRWNGQFYDNKWAAIGTKEFRAFKFELRVTGSPVVLGMNGFQSGLLQYAFATLPIELQSSEAGRKIGEISKAEMSGHLPKPKHN
ncbi:P-loop containing nucleoside triphosphate hydrolase protein [Hyaloscypha sp. PMI_1271]|nr:P-loop containing nucleoside triphosphate hydrolase protein [Hyaloscypha sp. PMI_1271]